MLWLTNSRITLVRSRRSHWGRRSARFGQGPGLVAVALLQFIDFYNYLILQDSLMYLCVSA